MPTDNATGFQRFSGYGENAPLDLDLSSAAVARQIANGCCRRTSTTGPKPSPVLASACTRSTSSGPRPPWIRDGGGAVGLLLRP